MDDKLRIVISVDIPAKNPCNGCSNRTIYCHIDCEYYKEYQRACEQAREKRLINSEFQNYKCERIRKTQSTRNRRHLIGGKNDV